MPVASSKAMPWGVLISAAVAGPPSPVEPGVPLPATVVIVPSGAIRRIRLFPPSATKSEPSPATTTWRGARSWAAVAGPPSPLQPPTPVPATLVTEPRPSSAKAAAGRGAPGRAVTTPVAATAATSTADRRRQTDRRRRSAGRYGADGDMRGHPAFDAFHEDGG